MENSKIEWCDHTINFWWGCTKVSPGCEHCYAESLDARFHLGETMREGRAQFGAPHWGPAAPRYLRVEAATREAFKYQRRAEAQGRRFRVFVNSMSDFFEDRTDLDDARLKALDVMRQTPDLTWMILTKRPERIKDILYRLVKRTECDGGELDHWLSEWYLAFESPKWRDIPPNIWLGTSAEDEGWLERRLPPLLRLPAVVHFLSLEPLLGPLNLRRITAEHAGGHPDWLDPLIGEWLSSESGCVVAEVDPVDWVIVGGESGHRARPMDIRWVRAICDDCERAKVPFFFKSWGEWAPAIGEAFWTHSMGNPYFLPRSTGPDTHDFGDGYGAVRVGGGKLAPILDSETHLAFPEVTHAQF